METSPRYIAGLTPAQYNPRSIKPENFEGLKFSIIEFGDLSGITFNLSTGNLVTGHQRVKGLSQLYGYDLPITEKGIEIPDGTVFPVRFVEWSIEKEKAALIAANNPHIQGEFTIDLQSLLIDLNEIALDCFKDLRFENLKNEDALFLNIQEELAGFDPNKPSSSEDYELGGKYQEAIKYTLIFDTKEQKEQFESFVERARLMCPQETISESVITYITTNKV